MADYDELKRNSIEKIIFIFILIITLIALIIGVTLLVIELKDGARWIASSGLLATLAGLFQLEVSGLFDKIIREYSNEAKYPYGPPSHITRQIIDNPDTPVYSWLRNALFFFPKTGFWLIVIGTLLQILAIWV